MKKKEEKKKTEEKKLEEKKEKNPDKEKEELKEKLEAAEAELNLKETKRWLRDPEEFRYQILLNQGELNKIQTETNENLKKIGQALNNIGKLLEDKEK